MVLNVTIIMKKFAAKTENLEIASLRVEQYFFDFPNRWAGLSELARTIGIAKTTATRVVNALRKSGFLEREVIGRSWRIQVNDKHSYNTTRKIPYHLQRISESGVVDYITETYPSARAVILFGSYRKGDDTDHSDVDLAVELHEGETHLEHLAIIEKLGYRKDVEVNVLFFTRKTVDPNVFANIANGIVLEGFLEVHP